VAEKQGVIAAETIAGLNPAGIDDYRMMPRAIFTSPQVASFGLTEQEAAETMEPLVSKFSMVANGKAHAIGAPFGFVKLVADPATRRLVGAHIVAPQASDLISELTLAHRANLTIDELEHNVHIHPTLSEGVQEAVHGLVGSMINA
jgi:dihydrolipoamide dehydrogenase